MKNLTKNTLLPVVLGIAYLRVAIALLHKFSVSAIASRVDAASQQNTQALHLTFTP